MKKTNIFYVIVFFFIYSFGFFCVFASSGSKAVCVEGPAKTENWGEWRGNQRSSINRYPHFSSLYIFICGTGDIIDFLWFYGSMEHNMM